ncbi:MAG: ankyrin repeat domain-containing protein, partial [Candidatus Dependentiae bacterium]|nr:ankyrin repeat domain-containing protein [Candidatus Dependentiae bacterium]
MNNRVAKCLLVSSLCAIVCHGMKQPGQLSAEVIRSCINGNVQEVEEFLRKCPQSLEDKDRNGFTPLMLAADVGHRSLAEMLLHRGARREALYETGQGMIKSTYDIIKIRLENAARR